MAEKLMKLERIVDQQSALLETLQNERKSSAKTNNLNEGVDKSYGQLSVGKIAIQRTCREIKTADPALSSGMYWIDPDGQGIGDDPVYVYCDMTTGKCYLYYAIATAIRLTIK